MPGNYHKCQSGQIENIESICKSCAPTPLIFININFDGRLINIGSSH